MENQLIDQTDEINLTESQITTNSDKMEVVPLVEENEKNVDLPAKSSKTILIALLMCVFISQSLYMNVVALLPQYAAEKFPHMSHFEVGLLMGIYPIAVLLSAPFIGDKLSYFGRKNVMTTGVLLMTVATLMFALGGYCDRFEPFYAVSFTARLLQGVADALVVTTVPSLIIIEYPRQQELYLGYMGLVFGAGLTLGPLMGSLAYRWLNYTDTFYFFAAYMLVLGLISVFNIPSRLNDSEN
ncbi:MAG: MFS transporter [Dolichospermum sp.]|nr:MFS transporter [Dolichospermum sp.]